MSEHPLLVSESGIVPHPADLEGWTILVYELSDSYASRFSKDGLYEVWIAIRPPEGTTGDRRILLPISFATKAQGDKAGAVLAKAFGEVRAIKNTPPPDPLECRHETTVSERYSRSGPFVMACVDCGKVVETAEAIA